MTSVPPSGITSIQLTKNTLRSWRGARGGNEPESPLRVKKPAGLHRRAAKTTALSSVSPTSSPGTFFLLLAEIKTCLSTPPGLRRGAKWGPVRHLKVVAGATLFPLSGTRALRRQNVLFLAQPRLIVRPSIYKYVNMSGTRHNTACLCTPEEERRGSERTAPPPPPP